MKTLYTLILAIASMIVTAAPPTVSTSNLSFPVVNGASFNIAWTAGNGTKRIIVARAGSPVTAIPQNGLEYTANTDFGSGQAIAPGQFVIYNNAFTSFYLTGLTAGTQYFFAFFEYNGSGATTEYMTSTFLTGNAFTSAAPTVQTSNLTFSNITGNSVTATITVGNGARRLILARQGSPVNADPADLTSYGGNNTYGSGTQIGSGNYVVYSSSGNNTVIGNLQQGTEYFFAVYEYNGIGEPVYKKPAYTTSVTTRTVPTIPSTNINTLITDGKELTFNWTNGNGIRRIIVAKQGSAVTAVPVDGVDYTDSPIFGNGTAIAPGEFVVYDGNFNSTRVEGLLPATIYHFRIYEYDGSGNTCIYLKNLFGSTSASTAVTPATQASNISFNNISGTTLQISCTPGDGKGRFIVARQGSAVNITPQDFTTYVANGSFGSGTEIGTGNFVLGNILNNGMIVSDLIPNTTYHFAIFEYNGLNQPMYRIPAATGNATTLGTVPVILANWNAMFNGQAVSLSWTTESEINTSHFNIKRSTDGIVFNKVQTLMAKGNVQVQSQYHTIDEQAPAGNLYYQLEIIDRDGKNSYSKIIKVERKSSDGLSIIGGNIVKDRLTASFKSGTRDQQYSWSIFNAQGQKTMNGVTTSANQFTIYPGRLAAGMYHLVLYSANIRTNVSFIKQ